MSVCEGWVAGLPGRVRVWMPTEFAPEVVARVLGVEPLPTVTGADKVSAPYLTVDGRINTPTSDFLRRHCAARPNVDSARRIASDLAS